MQRNREMFPVESVGVTPELSGNFPFGFQSSKTGRMNGGPTIGNERNCR